MRLLWILPWTAGLAAAAEVDFAHDVAPILKKRCAECHTGDKKKGGLSMNTRRELLAGSENGKVLEPGKSAESRLFKLVTSNDPEDRMPPKGDRLSAAEVEKLRAWIDGGLAWEEGFTFKKPAYEPPLKPRRPSLPPARDGREHPVDRILDAYLAEKNLPRPAPLDDAGFFRRVHLDLIGLLPPPEKLAAFLTDLSPDKRAKLTRELLADDVAYGEHWLTFWNDLLRNDYAGTGYIDGGRKQISSWLYRALLENMPYDQFARALIAPTPENEGFANGIKWRGNVSAGQAVPVQFAQSIGQTFLGLNLKCASCHDSFIDRWKLEESYGLAAIFAEQPLELHRCDKPVGRMAKPAWLFPELGQIDASKPRAERLKDLAALMTHPENGRFTRTIVNRLWRQLMGRGIVHPVDAMQSPPWNEDLLDYLASHFVDLGYDSRKMLEFLCASAAYQSRSEVVHGEEDAPYVYAGPRAKRLTAEQFVDAVWSLAGGAPGKFDAPVKRGRGSGDAKDLAGARWVWRSDNTGTLPAAGEAIVLRKVLELRAAPTRAAAAISADNSHLFFANGQKVGQGDNWEAPDGVSLTETLKAGTNELLLVAKNGGAGPNPAGVFLAARIRFPDGQEQFLGTDDTWQWSATLPDANGRFASEPADWRPAVVVTQEGWTRRVGAELAAALNQGMNASTTMVRASLLKNDLLMRALGRPNREQIVSTRPNNLTTLEAMDLNNGQILTTRLEDGARRLAARHWNSAEELIDWLYAFTLSRLPTSEERSLAKEIVGEKIDPTSLQDLLWAVVMLPEFQLVR